MKELKELSVNYAIEKTNEMFSQIVAQAFADGYRMGYKDRENEIPMVMRNGKTEYVDLGLPSGTLWSTNYEEMDEQILFLPFQEAVAYAIPSEEQWKELMSVCRWSYRSVRNNISCEYKCIGPNGNSLSFFSAGMISTGKMYSIRLFFWLKDNGENVDKNSAYVYVSDKIDPKTYMYNFEIMLTKTFMGYKLPIRLVKSK